MDDVEEIPKYFICPISLQIMKDPVTAVTGITYDRESIEQWQSHSRSNTCPVTNQPLSLNSALTPNHTLRRLIQSWCSLKGINQIPTLTLNPPLKKSHVISLLKNLNEETLGKLENLAAAAAEDGCNDDMICLQEAGVAIAMWRFIEGCHKKGGTHGLKEALKVLYLVGTKPDQIMLLFKEIEQIIDSLTCVLGLDRYEVYNNSSFKFHAVSLLKSFIDKANPNALERLKPVLFERLVLVLKEKDLSSTQAKASLDIMLSSCPWGRNRAIMVESGAIHELIELGLACPDKSTMESIFGVLFHLCSCADGRDQLLSHAAGLAFVSKKLLRVSPKADDRIMLILSLVSKFSCTDGVVQEMLRLGTVSKLCMVLQYDRASYLKEKAREILRRHSNVWRNSDCISGSVDVTTFSW